MALTPGSTPAPNPNPTLPSPAQAAAHTSAQKGAMMKRGKPKPKPNKALASAAASSPYQAQAQAELDPIIAAIRAAAMGQAQNSDAAIQGLTDSYAKGIAGIDYGAPYSGAEAQQAAVDSALQQSATGQGSNLAAALSQRLSQLQGSSGAGAVQQEAAQLASQGAGAGGAELATGSAALNQLIADAAAAKSYGTKMPGVIRSAGLQGVEQSQGQAQQAINQGTAQAESQLPQIEQALIADHQNAIANKLAAQMKQAQLASTNAYHAGELNLRGQQIASTNAYHSQEIALRGQALQLQAQKAVASNKAQWARIGISNQHLQLEIAKQDMAMRSGGLSPAETSRYHALAGSWASRMLAPTVNPTTGKAEPKLHFEDAMTQALKSGVPLSIAFPIFMKEAKAAGTSPALLAHFKQEYAPLDSSLRQATAQAAGKPGMFSGMTGAIGAPFGAAARAATSAAGKTLVALAHHFVGTPYVWGGESPKGFDCSGFAQYLYGKVGVSIPRTTYTQWTAKNGHAVPKGQLLPGDLVFFKGSDSIGGLPGHVGIYIGNGMMIDAPHTGADVRVESVGSFGGYMGARRFGKA